MKKNCLIFVCLLFSTFCGCLKPVEEFSVPVMSVSYSENDLIYFSEIQTASVNVKIRSEEDLLGFKMYCNPPRWHLDSTFENYTHNVEFNLNFTHQKGYVVDSPDSTYTVTMLAYTERDTVVANRTLKYKFEYPEIDSCDIELFSDPTKPCFVDIKNKCAYNYTLGASNYYDLVFVNELRNFYTSVGIGGIALVSPNAQAYLSEYFEYVNDLLPPYEEGYLEFRETKIGYINLSSIGYDNRMNVSADLVGIEDGWSQVGLTLDGQFLGFGMFNLQRGTLYKCQLYDGSYVVFYIVERDYTTVFNTRAVVRFYFQK